MKTRSNVFQRLVLFGILVLMCLLMTLVSDKFLTINNLTNILRQNAMIAIVAVSGTMVMITGGLDISIGSGLALTGVLYALMAQAGMPLWTAAMIAMLAGGVIGCINAGLIVGLRINHVIATLATQYAMRGAAYLFANGKTVVDGLPPDFTTVGRGYIWILPIPVVIMIVIYLIFSFIMNKTLLGKYTYAIGGNKETAVLSGIPVNRIMALLYILMGLFTGLSGVLMSSRLGSGNPQTGTGFEFDIIVSVLLGGTSMLGGEGSLMGTFIAVLIVGVMGNGLNLLGVDSFYQYICKGVILVIAILIDMALKGGGLFKRVHKIKSDVTI